MSMDNAIRIVTHPTPVDVSTVRDPGMKSLIILAASLGWNVHQKHGQPVVVTARDGVQKRLPTNTSIRMGVFQSALSTIMAHTDEDTLATVELMDAVIAITKPPADHARRMRLAVGETPAQHRERVAAIEAESKGSREPEHLTQRIDQVLDAHFREVLEGKPEEPEEVSAPAEPEFTPADEEEHGKLIKREPLMARSSKYGTTSTYQSDTSYERVWEDGFVDYECMICGKALTTSRGAGGHVQIHKRPESAIPARHRATVFGRIEQPRAVPVDLEWVEPPMTAKDPETVPVYLEAEPTSGAQQILDKVINLVVPTIIRERDRLQGEVIALRSQNAELRQQLEEIEGDFDALMELAANRRKPLTDKEGKP